MEQASIIPDICCRICSRALARLTAFCPYCGTAEPAVGSQSSRYIAGVVALSPANTHLTELAQQSNREPTPADAPKRAGRHFLVGNSQCWTLAQLVQALRQNWLDGLAVIRSSAGIESWLRHDLSDQAAADRVAGILRQFGMLDDSAKLSLAIAVLDPTTPPIVDGNELTRARLVELAQTSAADRFPQVLRPDHGAFACYANLTQAGWLKKVYVDWTEAQTEAETRDADIRKFAPSLAAVQVRGDLNLLLLCLNPDARGRLASKLTAMAEQPNVKACPWIAQLLPPPRLSTAGLWLLQRRIAQAAAGAPPDKTVQGPFDGTQTFKRLALWGGVALVALVAIIVLPRLWPKPPTQDLHNSVGEMHVPPDPTPNIPHPAAVPPVNVSEKDAKAVGRIFHKSLQQYKSGNCRAGDAKAGALDRYLVRLFGTTTPNDSNGDTISQMHRQLADEARHCKRMPPSPQ